MISRQVLSVTSPRIQRYGQIFNKIMFAAGKTTCYMKLVGSLHQRRRSSLEDTRPSSSQQAVLDR